MVTRTVILVTPSEAAAFAATSTLSSSSSAAAAAADSINNAPAEQINLDEELQTNSFNHPSYTKRSQHPSPGGLVQLQNQKGPMDGEQNDSEDSGDDGKIRGVASDEYCLDEVGKKRGHPSMESISGKDDIKRQRVDTFVLDLTDVPPQPPIPKSGGRIKEGASKYKGAYFNKAMNKWVAKIYIEGKERYIGCYENEEDAAANYARAVFKYRGQGALDKAREQGARDTPRVDAFTFDLTDVPPQPPVPKCGGYIKEGASKYRGVFFDKQRNKWLAQIYIDGMNRRIGYYDNEEEAAVDYARAVFKYKGPGALDKAREHRARDISSERKSIIIDLTDVPPQLPIPKSAGRIKEEASKYKGVCFHKPMKKWLAQIIIEGKTRHIGSYVNEEEAAADYARAVFKYKGQGALDNARESTR
eukprot:scaffold4593_cov74-Skeletonema_dohrnii-CCMP3373.AAC.3